MYNTSKGQLITIVAAGAIMTLLLLDEYNDTLAHALGIVIGGFTVFYLIGWLERNKKK